MKLFSGLISIEDQGDSKNLVCVDSTPASKLLSEFNGKPTRVEFTVAEEGTSQEDAEKAFKKTLLGYTVAVFEEVHSNIPGLERYLRTNDELIIGGFDLLAELKASVGKSTYISVEDSNPFSKN